MNEYELMAVLHPRLTADETDGAIEFIRGQITSNGGEVVDVDNWGRRRLAYPVDANFEGTYVLATLRLPPEGARPLESQMILSEDVIRHLLIRGIIPYQGADPRESQVRPGSTAPAQARPEAASSVEAADAPAADEADEADEASPLPEAAAADAPVAADDAADGDDEAPAADVDADADTVEGETDDETEPSAE